MCPPHAPPLFQILLFWHHRTGHGAHIAFGSGHTKKKPQLTGSVAKISKKESRRTKCKHLRTKVDPPPERTISHPCGDLPTIGMGDVLCKRLASHMNFLVMSFMECPAGRVKDGHKKEHFSLDPFDTFLPGGWGNIMVIETKQVNIHYAFLEAHL